MSAGIDLGGEKDTTCLLDKISERKSPYVEIKSATRKSLLYLTILYISFDLVEYGLIEKYLSYLGSVAKEVMLWSNPGIVDKLNVTNDVIDLIIIIV
jgi:hypothetical protein